MTIHAATATVPAGSWDSPAAPGAGDTHVVDRGASRLREAGRRTPGQEHVVGRHVPAGLALGWEAVLAPCLALPVGPPLRPGVGTCVVKGATALHPLGSATGPPL